MISASSQWLAENAFVVKVPIYAFEITGYRYIFANGPIAPLSQVVPWMIGIDDLQITVNDLDGGADLADLVVHVQDRDHAITSDFPTFTFEGKGAVLKAGWGHIDPATGNPVSDLAYSDFVTLFTGKIDSIESENSNNDYVFTCPDVRNELARLIFQKRDDGRSTDSNFPVTLLGHPLDIFISVLEDEIGLDPSQIDLATIQNYRDNLYSGASMQFSITSPPIAKDFLENEILKPLGAYLFSNNLGQITVSFFYPLSSTPVFAFDEDNVLEIPGAGQADLINQVSTRFDADSSSNFASESVWDYDASIAKFGLFGQQLIESHGLRSGLNGFFFSGLTAFLLFLRYGNKQLLHGDNGKVSSSNPILATWDAALLEPGDLVTLTHADVPDRSTGTMGITNKTYVVMDRIWQFFTGNVQYKLLAIDLSKFKQYLISAAGYTNTFLTASVNDKGVYMFMANDSDQYSNGAAGNTIS